MLFATASKGLKVMICYDKFFKMLHERHLTKTSVRERAGITKDAMLHITRNQPVSLRIIEKLCKELNCGIDDIVEYIPDDIAQSRKDVYMNYIVKRHNH